MFIRVRSTGQLLGWSEFREMLLAQNPSELITVAEETEQWVNDHGADVVYPGAPATGGTVYQYSEVEGTEQDEHGVWRLKYRLGPVFVDSTHNGVTITAAEHEANHIATMDDRQSHSVRTLRNNKLRDLDWTQGKDVPESISGPAAVIRQALRDIPSQEGFPWNITWPDA